MGMKIISAEFLNSIASEATGKVQLTQLSKPSFPGVVFLGRSNVGKSTLINILCNKRNLARTSSTPGKTRYINYYLINKKIYFVDLPGYGYAKVPEQMRASWGKLIEEYLKKRKQIRLAVQLIDARQGATELDKIMIGWLEYYRIPYIIVFSKADKIARSKVVNHLSVTKKSLGTLHYCKDYIPFSAITGDGKSEILRALDAHLEETESLVA